MIGSDLQATLGSKARLQEASNALQPNLNTFFGVPNTFGIYPPSSYIARQGVADIPSDMTKINNLQNVVIKAVTNSDFSGLSPISIPKFLNKWSLLDAAIPSYESYTNKLLVRDLLYFGAPAKITVTKGVARKMYPVLTGTLQTLFNSIQAVQNGTATNIGLACSAMAADSDYQLLGSTVDSVWLGAYCGTNQGLCCGNNQCGINGICEPGCNVANNGSDCASGYCNAGTCASCTPGAGNCQPGNYCIPSGSNAGSCTAQLSNGTIEVFL